MILDRDMESNCPGIDICWGGLRFALVVLRLMLSGPVVEGRKNNIDCRSVVLSRRVHSLPPFPLIESFHCPGPKASVAEIAIYVPCSDSTADPIGKFPPVEISLRRAAKTDTFLEFESGDPWHLIHFQRYNSLQCWTTTILVHYYYLRWKDSRTSWSTVGKSHRNCCYLLGKNIADLDSDSDRQADLQELICCSSWSNRWTN